MNRAFRMLYVLVGREVEEGYAEIDDKRTTVWVERPLEGSTLRSHTITFSLADRGIEWADAGNDEEARAFRAYVSLR